MRRQFPTAFVTAAPRPVAAPRGIRFRHPAPGGRCRRSARRANCTQASNAAACTAVRLCADGSASRCQHNTGDHLTWALCTPHIASGASTPRCPPPSSWIPLDKSICRRRRGHPKGSAFLRTGSRPRRATHARLLVFPHGLMSRTRMVPAVFETSCRAGARPALSLTRRTWPCSGSRDIGHRIVGAVRNRPPSFGSVVVQ